MHQRGAWPAWIAELFTIGGEREKVASRVVFGMGGGGKGG